MKIELRTFMMYVEFGTKVTIYNDDDDEIFSSESFIAPYSLAPEHVMKNYVLCHVAVKDDRLCLWVEEN